MLQIYYWVILTSIGIEGSEGASVMKGNNVPHYEKVPH